MAALPLYFMSLLVVLIAVDALEPSKHEIKITSPSSKKSVILKSEKPVSIRLKNNPTERPIQIHVKHSSQLSSLVSKSSSSEVPRVRKNPKYHLVFSHESSESDSFIKKRDNSDSLSSSSSDYHVIYKRKKPKRNIYLQYPKMTKHKVVIATKKYNPLKEKSKYYKKLNKKLNKRSRIESKSSSSSSSLSSSSSSSQLSSTSSSDSIEKRRSSKKGKLNFFIVNRKSRLAKNKIKYDKIAHKNINNYVSSSSESSSSSYSSSSSSSSSSSGSSSRNEMNTKKTSAKGKVVKTPLVVHTINHHKTPKNVHGQVHYQVNNNGRVQNGHYAILSDSPVNGPKTRYNIQHNVHGQGEKTMMNRDPVALVNEELRKLNAEYPWLNL